MHKLQQKRRTLSKKKKRKKKIIHEKWMNNSNMQGAKNILWLEIRFQINCVGHKTVTHSTVMYFHIIKSPSILTHCVLSNVQSGVIADYIFLDNWMLFIMFNFGPFKERVEYSLTQSQIYTHFMIHSTPIKLILLLLSYISQYIHV